jgi:hypothetical protein
VTYAEQARAWRARKSPVMQFPFLYSLDQVDVHYDDSTREYNVSYQRVIRNVGVEPILATSGRIAVNVFPDAPALARPYYRRHPLQIEDLAFEVYDEEGMALVPRLTHESDSTLEFVVPFQDLNTKEKRPLYPNETRRIFSSYRVSDTIWGPYLERLVTVPCEQMSIVLRFPNGLVKVWGQQYTAAGETKAIDPPIQFQKEETHETYSWHIVRPSLGAKYKLEWYFRDKRLLALQQQMQREISPGLSVFQAPTHSPDFRSVHWFGTDYSFTPIQAACVENLWQGWANSTPDISQAYLLGKIGTKAKRVDDLLKMNSAWRTMIVRGNTKGTLRLQIPDKSKNVL